MYTYLTAYDQNRHLASLSISGAFDGTAAAPRRPQTHPIRRIRHALSALARHDATVPTMPVILPV